MANISGEREGMTWKIEKLTNPANILGYDICLQIKGLWIFSFMKDGRDGYSSLVIFNRIIWDKWPSG